MADIFPFRVIFTKLMGILVSYFLKGIHWATCKHVDVEAKANSFTSAGKKRYNYNGDLSLLSEAITKANSVLDNEEFYRKLAEIETFDDANVSGKVLGNLIRLSKVEADIEIYESIWPWSKATAYTTPIEPNTIKLNGRKFNERTSEEWAVTLIHEFVHLVDFENEDFHFGHNGNQRNKNEHTAPYMVEKIAEELIYDNK